MKRFLSVLLIILMLLSLTSCSNDALNSLENKVENLQRNQELMAKQNNLLREDIDTLNTQMSDLEEQLKDLKECDDAYYDDYDSNVSESTEDPVTTSNEASVENYETITVYVTQTGNKYHNWGCQYLSQSCVPMDYYKAINNGYTACSKCY